MKELRPEKRLIQRTEELLRLSKNKTVLHLGCTNSPYTQESIDADMLLHDSLNKVAKRLYGLDNDAKSLSILEEMGYQDLILGDIEGLSPDIFESRPEVIIAGEIIEHLNNPGLFLEGVSKIMSGDSKLVITTINSYCALRFAQYWLRGAGGLNEPVHPDHVAYYSFRTLKLLLERHGLKISEFYFYDIGDEHRPHMQWYWKFINDAAVRFSPQLSDGVIAICEKSDG